MQTKNILIAALAIAVGVLSALLYRANSDCNTSTEESGLQELMATVESIDLDPETAKSLCAARLADNDGGEMSLDRAISAIHHFDSLHPQEEVQAYHMGLTTIERMLDSARAYNNQSGNFDHIIGFRFYRAVTSRIIGQTVVNNKYDLVIVPTLQSDADLHTVRPETFLAASVPIFSYLRPCPKLCTELLAADE